MQLERAVEVYDDMLACAWRKELQVGQEWQAGAAVGEHACFGGMAQGCESE